MFRQIGPGLHLDSPSLVIGQVQMQPVQLVERDQIDVVLHVVDAEEVPGHVEHGAAPDKSRPVDNVGERHAHGPRPRRMILDGPRQQLAQRLHAIEETRRVVGGNSDPICGDRQLVTLRRLATALEARVARWMVPAEGGAARRAHGGRRLQRRSKQLRQIESRSSHAVIGMSSKTTAVAGVTAKVLPGESSIDDGAGMTP